MQAELKLQESEEEMQEFLALKIQKDLEVMLIAELLEKLQPKQLEKTVLEEETQKRVQEDEEVKRQFLEYGLEVETAYSKDKGAYQVERPYEQDHGNQTGYEK
ncbi:MAG: hypothetical protein Q8O03_01720 [Nanoarchaeota archaeon]|nr:hypothetical protein [Nanoarchaeota archaeon]